MGRLVHLVILMGAQPPISMKPGLLLVRIKVIHVDLFYRFSPEHLKPTITGFPGPVPSFRGKLRCFVLVLVEGLG